MASNADSNTDNTDKNPLNEFSGCHESIIDNFQQLQHLLSMLDRTERIDKIKSMAGAQLWFFKEVVREHHIEEEQELFRAVMDSAGAGEEADQARKSIKRLMQEHRDLEAMWASIEGDIRRLSKGKAANLDHEVAEKLAHDYLDHAIYEEQYFLPLAAKILKKNDLSALGLSLHMRQQDVKIHGYI